MKRGVPRPAQPEARTDEHSSMKVLLVEDDLPLAEALMSFLQARGFVAEHVATRKQASSALEAQARSVVLLDLNLPDGDGSTLLPTIRRTSPGSVVIMLTARDQVSDRIQGLDAGADDYLVKPFDAEELLARLRAVERRTSQGQPGLVQVGALQIHLSRMSVERNGVPINLTPHEWTVLRVLASQPDRLHSPQALLDALYGKENSTPSNALEVFVSRLRSKLGRRSIRTVRGLGYWLVGE
jgi:two-component system, OmpR family, response regulator